MKGKGEREGGLIGVLSDDEQLFTPGGHPVEMQSERLALALLRYYRSFETEYKIPITLVHYFYSWLDLFQDYPVEDFMEEIQECFKKDWTLDCPYEDEKRAVIWRDMFAYRELREIEFRKWIRSLSPGQAGGVVILARQYGTVNLAYILSHKSRPRYAYQFGDYFKEAYDNFVLPDDVEREGLWKLDFMNYILRAYKTWSKYAETI